MSYLENLQKNSTITNTKGGKYYSTTYDANLDIFVGISRYNDTDEIIKKFKKALVEDSTLALANLIYLLDIRTEDGSGIDAARLIREEYDDWVSMIIMISGFPEYRYEALGKRLMLVDFINKLDHPEQKLQDALLICMKNYDNKYKSLKYTYKNVAYNIEFRTIIKIEKEIDSKRCAIYAEDGKHYIQGSLNDVLEKLDKRFFKCNRGVALNIEQVQSYNFTKNVALLKNGEEFKDISRSKRRELYNRVRGIM